MLSNSKRASVSFSGVIFSASFGAEVAEKEDVLKVWSH